MPKTNRGGGGGRLAPRLPGEPDVAAPKCGAKTVAGKQCSQAAGFGTKHPGTGNCKFHGGLTPAGNVHAARELGRGIARARKMSFGGEKLPNESAEEILLDEVRRTAALVRWLESIISKWYYEDLPEDSTKAGLTGLPNLLSEHYGDNGVTVTDTETRAWLQIYREERAHLARSAKMCIDAGLSERMVRVEEEKGRLLVGAIKRILDALDLTPRQARMVPQIVPAILREIEAAPA